jgi:hypothetical protein
MNKNASKTSNKVKKMMDNNNRNNILCALKEQYAV